MMSAIKNWWQARSAREQILVATMLALLVPTLAWLFILRPLNGAIALATENQKAAVARLGQVTEQASAVKGRLPHAVQPPRTIIANAATTAGFSSFQLEAGLEDRVSFRLQTAKPIALFNWIDALDQEGVFVESITIRPNSDATVSVAAVFRGRKG